jgi:hypothetical protein
MISMTITLFPFPNFQEHAHPRKSTSSPQSQPELLSDSDAQGNCLGGEKFIKFPLIGGGIAGHHDGVDPPG